MSYCKIRVLLESHYPLYPVSLYYCIRSVILSFPYIVCIVPPQVTSVTLSKATSSGKPALSVTWTTPQSDVTISQYRVEYRRQGNPSWRTAKPVSLHSTTSTLLEGLDAGTVYEVRISAVSAIGNGMWSRVESKTTFMSELSI